MTYEQKKSLVKNSLTQVGLPNIFEELVKQPFSSCFRINDYLWQIDIDKFTVINYDAAEEYYKNKLNTPLAPFACTSARYNNIYMRNLDWYYNNNAECVIRVAANDDRHASVGISAPLDGITEQFLRSGNINDAYTTMPCMAVDGINDAGVVVSYNVVPKPITYFHGQTWDPTNIDYNNLDVIEGFPKNGSNPGKKSLMAHFIPRYILDHCVSVDDAIEKLNNFNIWCPVLTGYEVHIMFADKDKTCVIEGYDNDIKFLLDNEHVEYGWDTKKAIITNFHVYNTHIVDGKMDRVRIQDNSDNSGNNRYTSKSNIEDFGAGVERYNIMLDGIENVDSLDDAAELMLGENGVRYSRSYEEIANGGSWYTEFVGNRFCSWSDSDEIDEVMPTYREAFTNKDRDKFNQPDNINVWVTTHTSLFDISNKKLRLYSQSDAKGIGNEDNYYEFTLEGLGRDEDMDDMD